MCIRDRNKVSKNYSDLFQLENSDEIVGIGINDLYSPIAQIDGNATSTNICNSPILSTQPMHTPATPKYRAQHETQTDLPNIALYNARSLWPKIKNFVTEVHEREIDICLITEVWENSESKEHKNKIEYLMEMKGIKYISTPRSNARRGGGTAIAANLSSYKLTKLEIIVPSPIEVVWGLLQPRKVNCIRKEIIICSFYSPPKSKKNALLIDCLLYTSPSPRDS